MPALPPLSGQPESMPWPTGEWTAAAAAGDVDASRLHREADRLLAQGSLASHGKTLALLAVHRGALVLERYGPGRSPSDTLRSWSMAKSMLHAAIGILVGEGRLDPAAPAPVPAWRGAADPRGAITLEHLLRMVDGLAFVEEYQEGEHSDVIEMLYGAGRHDVAAYAESRPPAHRPGTWWNYSSGTSNVVSAILGRTLGGKTAVDDFLRARLFDPIGMKSALPRFDSAGTFIGSSFVFATARDFARFGLLYLRDGVWEGRRLLPAGWVDHARTPTPASHGQYGAHWWLATDGSGIFHCSGFRGQYIAVDPTRDLVLVRSGASTPEQRAEVLRSLRAIVECFPLDSRHPTGGTT